MKRTCLVVNHRGTQINRTKSAWIFAKLWFQVLFAIISYFTQNLGAQPAELSDLIRAAIETKNEKSYLALVSEESAKQRREHLFFQNVLSFPYEKITLHQAEKNEKGLILHVFFQGAREARFESWLVRTTTHDGVSQIDQTEVLNAVTGLYRLNLDEASIPVRNFQFHHLNVKINFEDGKIFPIRAGDFLAGILFLGKGILEFDPVDPIERHQVALFAKRSRLHTKLESFYIRAAPFQLHNLFGQALSQPSTMDKELYKTAQRTYSGVDRTVYSVRVPSTEDLWFTQVVDTEIYSEMKTTLGTLVYQFTPGEAFDVLLARKEKESIISLYNSEGITNPPERAEDFKIDSYKMSLSYDPISTRLSAVTEITIVNNQNSGTRIIFRLNPELRVNNIQSDQGTLIYIQEKKTSNLHVILNEPLAKDQKISLKFFYAGKVPPELRRPESMSASDFGRDYYLPPTALYSNQSNWYPQLVSRPYTTLEATVTVPEGYIAVMNGKRLKTEPSEKNVTYTYSSEMPAKYFSLFVGRMDGFFAANSVVPMEVYYVSMDKNAAQQYARQADLILRFFTERFGKYPYSSFTLVLRPVFEPGGHAPASIAIVNRVFQFFQKKFADDPLYIPEFPYFALAHEIAHQWWGQAVGWRTYRDQWLSEGFAQYAAWEYTRSQYDAPHAQRLAENFLEWIEEKTYAGPLILGARLGHISRDGQAFSAVLYDKGAYTLSMLRIWMGEEKFASGLSNFYETYRFRKVTVEDFRSFMQGYSDVDLTLFFRQWLYGWDLPSIHWSDSIDSTGPSPVLNLSIEQKESPVFQLKIPLEARSKSGEIFRSVLFVEKRAQEFSLQLPFMPSNVELDPRKEVLVKLQQVSD